MPYLCCLLISFFIPFIFSGWLKAQPASDTTSIQVYLEDFLDLMEEEQLPDEETLAEIQLLLAAPVNLNSCNAAELIKIPFIDPILADIIIAARDSIGHFDAVADLAKIKRLPAPTFDLIQHFLTVGAVQDSAHFKHTPTAATVRTGETTTSSEDLSDNSRPSKSTRNVTVIQGYSRRLDLSAGYHKSVEEGGFQGRPAALFTRLSANFNDKFSFKMTLEKDAGEAFVWNPKIHTPGFDHVTGAFQYKGNHIIKLIVLGDFTLMTGQGLLFWRATGQGKGLSPVQDPVRLSAGVKAVASREENAFFRGGAITFQPVNHLQLSAFYSKRSLDATLHSTDDSLQTYISSLSANGLHRTTSEMGRKDVFEEQLGGGFATLSAGNISLGITGYLSRFSHPFQQDNSPEKRFSFTGNRLRGLALNGRFNPGPLHAFSEFAVSAPGGKAYIAGVAFQANRIFNGIFLWRNFDKTYTTFHGNAFAEQRSALQNEEGFYAAFQLNISPQWTTAIFVDFYSFPWLKTNLLSPTSGFEFLATLRFQPRKWMRTTLYYRLERGESAAEKLTQAQRIVKTAENTQKQFFRVQQDYTFSEKLRTRSRFEFRGSYAGSAVLMGALTCQDVVWTPLDNIQIQGRLSVFNSDGGDAVLFSYENDLLYRFTIRSFTGNGTRNFILLKWRLRTQLTLEAKYGTTRYGRVITQGTGADAYSGTLVREILTQIIWRI